MLDNKESYELDTGLIDDYEVVVENAYFGFHEKYLGGDLPLLILSCASPDEDMAVRDELFSIGRGWEVAPGGERVEGKEGKEKFLASSWIGRLIVRCSELDMPGFDGGDGGSVLDFIADRGSAQEAHIWIGLRFRMKREEADFGDMGKKSHIMPTQCLGLMTGADITSAKNAIEADFADYGEAVNFDGEASAEPLAKAEPATDEQDQVALALLKPLAEAAETLVDFQTTAVASYASKLSDEMLGRLMDPERAKTLYEELRE